LLTVLNSYKAWETGDIPTLISYMGDTLTYVSSQGEMFSGPTAEITKDWQAYRDSISSVKIEMYAWRKNHSVDKNENVITLWYDEFVTHKSGKVDSAAWHDINVVSDGKIIWYSQYRRPFVKR
jgi:ketosteroid isomerase-like protein